MKLFRTSSLWRFLSSRLGAVATFQIPLRLAEVKPSPCDPPAPLPQACRCRDRRLPLLLHTPIERFVGA